MSTRLVILGLLQKKSLHGYEIKHIIEEHMGDWTSIAFGSIYFALSKLTQEGLLKEVGTERTGNRPSRRLYQATEKGREEFLRLLHEVWTNLQEHYFDLDVALFFHSALETEEITNTLGERIRKLEEQIRFLQMHKSEQLRNPYVPKIAEPVFDHSLMHLAAELEWLKQIKKKFETGQYP